MSAARKTRPEGQFSLSEFESVGDLHTLFTFHPRLTLRWGTHDVLDRYRNQEPGLVSSATEEGDVKVVLLEYDDTFRAPDMGGESRRGFRSWLRWQMGVRAA